MKKGKILTKINEKVRFRLMVTYSHKDLARMTSENVCQTNVLAMNIYLIEIFYRHTHWDQEIVLDTKNEISNS